MDLYDRAGDGGMPGKGKVAPQPPSPTKRKVPRQLTGRFVLRSVDFSQTFRSTRTGCRKHLAYHRRRANAGIRNPQGKTMEGVYTRPGPAKEAAPPSTEKSRRRGTRRGSGV